jgi:murein DD-endopeptidase MepM/ murein hydrolase activator NlpD
VCPVDRPRRFTDSFGDARYFGGYHRHTGIDIMAPFGTPVRAPFSGFARTTSNPAGGLGVYVEGRKGFVYNAHLARLGKRGRVRTGTVVGYVGNSGNARGGSPHNHFEWHPKGGPAVNPYRLLVKACPPKPKRAPAVRRPRPGRFHYLRTRHLIP